jgi:glc operon protein GlcG
MRITHAVSLVVGTALLFIAASAGAQAPGAPAAPAAPPAYGPAITLEQAKKVLAGAEAESMKNRWPMAIVVLDSGGHMVAFHRLDGTQIGSIEVAKDKARSAVYFRRPSKVFQDLVAQGGANLRLFSLTGASLIEGGVPLIVDGKIVGSIGVSGGTAEQDGQVAKAGADALK